MVPPQEKSERSSELLPVQLDMALAALQWSKRDLMANTGISLDTIARFKRGERLKASTIGTMQYALEAAGVILIPPDEQGGPGVRLRKADA